MSFSEVRARELVVFEDGVFDLKAFESRHPGDLMRRLRGTDATFHLMNAHAIRGALTRKPAARFRVGRIDLATIPAADRALRDLYRVLRGEGFFAYRRSWLVFDVVRMLLLFLAGAALSRVSALAGYALLTVAYLNVMWWVHDVCHDSVFSSRRTAERWAEAASMLFVGTPVLDYQYRTHRIHHALTNVIGGDHALETGPIVWDERMRDRTKPLFVKLQPLLWFLVVLPATVPLFLVAALVDRIKARDFRKVALTALRWSAVFTAAHFFHVSLATLLVPLLAAGYLLALISSLNHFHMPMTDALDASFTGGVARVSQNMVPRLVPRSVFGWLVGGLDFHIEHHLFATMPRRNYARIAPRVQALFREHGLPYSTCTFPTAVAQLMNQLREPFASEKPRARPEQGLLFRYSIDALPTTIVIVGVALGLLAVLGNFSAHVAYSLIALSLLARFLGPAHQHNHSHLKIFTHSSLNGALDIVFSLASGHVTATWELQHGLGHHRQFLDPKRDVAGNQRFAFIANYPPLLRRLVFMVLIDALTIPDAYRVAASFPKKRRSLRARLLVQLALQAAIMGALIWASPGLAIATFVVPNILLRWLVSWTSYGQHEDAPTTNVYDASITRYGVVSRVLLNVGLHTVHHEKPTLHWSLLPARNAKIAHLIPKSCVRGMPGPSDRLSYAETMPASIFSVASAKENFQ